MIDLTNITLEQANKIECALIMLETDIDEKITAYEKIALDEDFTNETRKTMTSNAEWWKEVKALIYN